MRVAHNGAVTFVAKTRFSSRLELGRRLARQSESCWLTNIPAVLPKENLLNPVAKIKRDDLCLIAASLLSSAM